jgi:hypothetical protein
MLTRADSPALITRYLDACSKHEPIRNRFSGVLLPNGKVLVAGGWSGSGLNSAELYDPARNTWTVTGSMIEGRSEFKAVVPSNGEVLTAGGFTGIFPTAKAETYNPATGTWSATGSMTVARSSYVLAVLPNGEILGTAECPRSCWRTTQARSSRCSGHTT